jgi:hypothetical protein
MAFNGSGTFVRVHDWTTDLSNTVPVTASRMDAEDDGFATGLSTCITKDGQTSTTAQIPFAQGIKLSDGSDSAPSFTFTSDTNSGLYRIGADNIGLTLNGAKVVDYSTTGVSITGTFAASGNVAINTNKFTVAGASGNTLVAGTLSVTGDFAVNTNKFNVTAASGNTTVAGTLGVTGATTLSAALTVSSGGAAITGNSSVTGTLSASSTLTASNGFTVSSGTVTLPANSVSNAAISTPPPVLLATLTASNSATLADTTSLTSAYSRYRLVIENLVPANDGTEIQLKYNVGGVQSSNYLSTRLIATEAAAVSGESTTHIKISGNGTMDNTAANGGLCGEITIYNPASTTTKKLANGTTFHMNDGGTHMLAAIISGIWTGSNAAVTGIQIAADSGNLTSGTVKIYGLS